MTPRVMDVLNSYQGYSISELSELDKLCKRLRSQMLRRIQVGHWNRPGPRPS
jgi:hypothetical protein